MDFIRRLVLLAFVYLGSAYSDPKPEVSTDAGMFIGSRYSVSVAGADHKLDSFLGIPYAKAPVGNLRFAKPVARESFDTKYEATKLGASCPQIAVPPLTTPELMSEDCLFLNIFAPASTVEAPGRAVLVFIHGGGFTMGSADVYAGDSLATYGDIIVVTINYRLGLWGFFSTGDEYAPGNLALWDQRLALQWVHQHIGSFGGDKDRVTIFGESAGSMSVYFHALYPPNKGLFQRGIAASGNPSTLHGSYARNVLSSAKMFAEAMNCPTETTKQLVDCVRAADYGTLLQTLGGIMMDPQKMGMLQFYPSMDNSFIKLDLNGFSKLSMHENFEELEFYRTLDIISGFNDVEGVMYVSMFIQNLEEFLPPRDSIKPLVSAILGVVLQAHQVPDIIIDMILSEYTDWNDPYNPEVVRNQFLKIFGDINMDVGTIEYMRVHSNTSKDINSYVYHFLPGPTNRAIPAPSWVKGANHGDELGYVFGLNEAMMEGAMKLFNNKYTTPKDWEYTLSTTMMNYWINFVKTGNPNTPLPVSPEWPKYKMGVESYMEFNKEEQLIKQYLYARETDFWQKTVPAVIEALTHAHHDTSSPFMKKQEGSCDANGDCDEG